MLKIKVFYMISVDFRFTQFSKTYKINSINDKINLNQSN